MRLHSNKLRAALRLLPALALAACASTPVPPDRYFRVDLPSAAAAESAPPRAAPELLLEPFEAHGVYAERALLYRAAQPGAALEQYRHQFWAEPPTLMLDDALRAQLRAALGPTQVHGRDTRARPAFVVRPRLRRLDQRFEANGRATAVYAVEFVVNDAGNGPRFVLAFEESAATAGTAPEDFVAALAPLVARANQALVERLAVEFSGERVPSRK